MADDIMIQINASFAGLTNALNSAASSITSSTNQMASQVSSSTSRMEASIEGLKTALAGLNPILATLGAALSVGKILETASEFEQLEIRLKAVMGSASAGKEAFDWIKQFAVETPYSVKQTTDAFMQLKNFGLDPMDGTLRKVSDAAAKYGNSTETVNRVTLALGQAWARGKLQGEDTLQMIDAGIPVYDLLSKATGKTAAEIQSMSEKGTMGKEVIRQLIDQMGKEGAGAAAEKMKSYAGAVSNLGDAIDAAINKMRDTGALNGITSAILALTDLVPTLGDVFNEAISFVMSILKDLWGVAKEIFSSISSIIDAVFGTNSSSVSAFEIFKNALDGVRIVLVSFRVGITLLAETIKTVLSVAVSYFVGFAKAAKAAMSGDFSGAISAWEAEANKRVEIVKQNVSNIINIHKKGNEDLEKILSKPKDAIKIADHKVAPIGSSAMVKQYEDELEGLKTKLMDEKHYEMSKKSEFKFWEDKIKTAKKGTQEYKEILDHLKSLHQAEPEAKGGKSGSKSDMQVLEKELAQRKIGELERTHHELSIQEEIRFWEEKLALNKKNHKESADIEKKISDLKLNELRNLNKELSVEESLNMKRIEMIEQNHRDLTKAEEYKFIKEKLNLAEQGSKERLDLLKKEQSMRLAMIIEANKSEQALQQLKIDREKNTALNDVAMEEINLKKSSDLRQISRVDELKKIQDFEDKKHMIELRAVQARIDIAAADPSTSKEALQRLLDEKLAIEQKHELAKAQTAIDIEKSKNEQIRSMSDEMSKGVQSSFEKFLMNPFKGGLKGMLQSFEDMLVQMAAKAAAQSIMDSLFSTTGAGGGAAGLSGMFAGLFGGGFANGGYTASGKFYQVGEGNKPELFRSGGKQYMIPGDSGEVVPNKDLQGGGDSNIVNNMHITVNSQSGNPEEIRKSVGQAAREAMGALGTAQRYR